MGSLSSVCCRVGLLAVMFIATSPDGWLRMTSAKTNTQKMLVFIFLLGARPSYKNTMHARCLASPPAPCTPKQPQWIAKPHNSEIHLKPAHWSKHANRCNTHPSTLSVHLADISAETAIDIGPAALGALALLGAGASVLAARAAVYARLQYIVAALLGNRIPPTATTVLQLGGSARDLYYYPRTVTQVTVVDPTAKPGVSVL